MTVSQAAPQSKVTHSFDIKTFEPESDIVGYEVNIIFNISHRNIITTITTSRSSLSSY